MRRDCADINLRDPRVLRPWVWDCIKRHYKRYDFRDMLMEYGLSREAHAKTCKDHDYTRLAPTVDKIAEYAAKCIADRHLVLPPVRIRVMKDGSNGKERQIGCESAIQQVFDSIARYAPETIWKRRIIPQQASSLKDRGPLYGVNMIQRWVMKDNRAMRYAKSHGLPYTSKMKYFVKLDIRKCFPSARLEIFMDMFRRDCKNEDLLWLWEELLKTHRIDGYQGFMIGANPSQWGMQYMLSFIYRYAMGLSVMRRNKRVRMVTHMNMFMDDILMTGSSRKNLKMAVRMIIRYTEETLRLVVKDTWHIKDFALESIDMMGYVIHRSGKVSIRGRVFLRGRRGILRCHRSGMMSVEQARRLMSYKGAFAHSNSFLVCLKLKADTAFRFAAAVISRYDREANYGTV